MVSRNVSSITVSDGGRIIIAYKQELRDNGAVVVLEPDVSGSPAWVDWQWDVPRVESVADSRSPFLKLTKGGFIILYGNL